MFKQFLKNFCEYIFKINKLIEKYEKTNTVKYIIKIMGNKIQVYTFVYEYKS